MIRLPDAFLTLPLAHRGLHGPGAPENSREAIEAAVAASYGIELDVQGTADGAAVVFHDDTLDRMTNETGPVRARTLAEMEQLDLTGGGTIPSLADVVEHVDGRVPLLIEIKDQSGTLGPTDGHLERAVAEAIRGARNVAVMSFNPAAVFWMKTLVPETPRGLVTDPFVDADWRGIDADTRARLAEIPHYDATGSAFISHNRKPSALFARTGSFDSGVECEQVGLFCNA